ncbi:MAG: sulfotransferase [Chromatiales bacterium]|nr:sulfotransferase [Chromatiales bacterium]
MSTAPELESEVRRLSQAGQLREAAEACDRLNQQHPDFLPGWITASDLALRVNEPLISVRAIDQALRLAPGRPDLLIRRVDSLARAGESQAAVDTARLLDGLVFETAPAASSFALLLHRLGLHAQARTHFARACELEPEEGQHYYNLASLERYLGNREAAEAALERCIECRPGDADAHLMRAGLQDQTAEQNNIESLLNAYELTRDTPQDRLRVCYALAKELEDIADYDRAFKYLEEGSTLRRKAMQYTPAKDLRAIEMIRETFSREVIERDIEGHISAEPIFVIGMPRTGTTLVERILSSHSVVRSAGESKAFAVQLVSECSKVEDRPPDDVGDLITRSIDVDFAALGEGYVNEARPVGERVAHFVDKMPLNFLYAGLIHQALPKARIVLLERDPMDTCYAVYKTLFEGVYPYSYDLVELANYFVAYRRLVRHWRDVMPGVMHVVRYEEIATNPQPVIEDLLQYCGLSFEQSCREFFNNPDVSTTASAVQVRSDVFTSSIGKWKNYAAQLEPVAEILENAQ